MTGKDLLTAFSGIDGKYVEEAAAPETQSPRRPLYIADPPKSTHMRRKLITLIIAACRILGLSITAYATGAVQSLLAKFANGFVLETPTDELRESRPDYAEWLDEQWETRAALEEIAGKAQQVHEEKKAEGLDDASITLLESYYDGEKFSMACRFDAPVSPVTFDVDKDDPQFAELREQREGYWVDAKDWLSYVRVTDQADQQLIQQKLEADGCVGFTTYEFYVGDHVLVNGEDPGFFHTEPNDNDGIFYVDPYYTSVFGSELPETCRNLPSLEITFTVRCVVTHYWLEGDVLTWMDGERTDRPVSFTLENING